MYPESIVESVNRILTDEFEIPLTRLTVEAQLYEDLELDSLDAVDLVVALEKSFDIQIGEDSIREIRTVGQIYAFIQQHLQPQQA
jgi:acyl carrier protein